ncbi:UDP-glycosyltransferase 73C5-like [Hordeum vulgare subsp. vulgare]|uniref:Glycosyltransferase n=1 Tax=Hordeum vulgare subsp. vulgare TaxID=112509 RepID=A0A8I6X9E9_HORVV|nr:UDP-glycosyltransferase 73C5-like [Hordeum vulgare subsp. vulgare]
MHALSLAMRTQTTALPSRPCAAPAPLHLVFVPFLARSHFAPLAAAAAAACGDGTTSATILTTPHFAALAPASVPVRAAPFSFPGGHEDFSLLPDESSAPAFFFAAEAALAPALAAAVRAHAGAVAVVSDAVLHWAPRVARECGVPHVTFHTIGAFAAASMVAVHLHRPDSLEDPVVVPGGFPVPVKLRRVHVNEEALAHLPLFRAAEDGSYAVAFNSFSALEADFAEYYRNVDGSPKKKVFLVGPRRAGPGNVTVTGDLKRDPILQWLDGQEAGSVVYACFGSTCGLSADQLKELGAGLRASGTPFLWVIPTTTDGTEQHDDLASSHGMVVAGRWAPQAEILAHRAVGGFVSHCGWNSVLDAVCTGVPLATWPLRAEQFLNEALLVDVLRVAVRVREVGSKADVEAVVPADAVASAVGKLMGDGADEAAARRTRVRDLGVAAGAAVTEGGSSCTDWARLVDELKALHGHVNEAPTDK